MTKGVAVFSIYKLHELFYAVVDPEKAAEENKQTQNPHGYYFQFFGLEDTILNHLKYLIKLKKGRSVNFEKAGDSILNSRQFSLICVQHAECLTLNFAAVDRMKKDYAPVSRRLFK